MKKSTKIGLITCICLSSYSMGIQAEIAITSNTLHTYDVPTLASEYFQKKINSETDQVVDHKEIVKEEKKTTPPRLSEPIVVSSDKMKYVGNTGDVLAKGRVDIKQGSQYIGTELIEGNTKTQLYSVPDKFVYKNEGMDFKGRHLSYNGNTRMGEMESLEGSMGKLYLRGTETTISSAEGNQYALTKEGMITTVHAMAWQNPPDYRIDGENILILPNDRVEINEAKFYIRNWHILTLKKMTSSLQKDRKYSSPFSLLPVPSYKDKEGFGLKGGISYPLGKNGEIFAHYGYYTNVGFKPSLGVAYYFPWGDTSLAYSKEASTINDRNVWIVKRPEFQATLKERKLGNTRLNYSARISYGYWSQGHVKGAHHSVKLNLRMNPIKLGSKAQLLINGGYQQDYYGYNHVTRRVPFAQARIRAKLQPNLSVHVGYNVFDYKGETPYSFDSIDHKHFIDGGLYYQVTRKDGLGYYIKYDTDTRRLVDQVISYHRDMHSMTGGISYNLVDHKYDVKLSFKDFKFSIG